MVMPLLVFVVVEGFGLFKIVDRYVFGLGFGSVCLEWWLTFVARPALFSVTRYNKWAVGACVGLQSGQLYAWVVDHVYSTRRM